MPKSHSPHGECGLKFSMYVLALIYLASLPAWGVRVEICGTILVREDGLSLPAWGVRVEIATLPARRGSRSSLPAWGVRVEI